MGTKYNHRKVAKKFLPAVNIPFLSVTNLYCTASHVRLLEAIVPLYNTQ